MTRLGLSLRRGTSVRLDDGRPALENEREDA
jgi:hypothetical protein